MKLSKVKSEREVTQLCLTVRDPMDCSLPGSSTHGILQARVLEWGATALSNIYVEYLKESTKKKKKFPELMSLERSHYTVLCYRNQLLFYILFKHLGLQITSIRNKKIDLF